MKAKIIRLLQSRSFGIFLLFWLLFGATTCQDNLRSYNLQQMGVDAIVAHHTFGLGHSQNSNLIPLGDTFKVGHTILAAKQPGQFVWGAIPYFALHLFGVDYDRDYELTAALVTWFSAGLMTALALAVLDLLLWQIWGFSRVAALIATLSLGLASTWLPYAGIAHHDMEAAALMVCALYAIERNRLLADGRNMRLVFLSGALLGLTVFTSMIPSLIVMVLGLASVLTRSIRTIVWRGVGFFAGILPLLTYNGYYFGSAVEPANVAGNYHDTFFSPRMVQFLDHMKEYLGTGGLSLWKYAPALTLGFIGIGLLPRALGRVRWTLGIAIFVHFAYVTNIETLGTCEYGPRYLLPIMPLLAPGVAALVDWRGLKAMPGKLLTAGALLAYGFLVNVVGALRGTMYCDLGQFALWDRFQGINNLPDNNSPLLGLWLAVPAVMFAIWAIFQLRSVFDPAKQEMLPAAPVQALAEAAFSKKKSKQKPETPAKQKEDVPAGAGKKK